MFEVTPEQILGVERSKSISAARGLAVWLTRRIYDFSYPELGRIFQIDHSTARHHVVKIDKALRAAPESRIARAARMLTESDATNA